MKPFFFLGGDDAEMREIAAVAEAEGIPFAMFVVKGMSTVPAWARAPQAAQFAAALKWCREKEFTPVLVEVQIDCPLPEGSVVIDHHGARAGEPPALIQMLSLLGMEPTRRQMLIAAHDAAFVYGLQAVGAMPVEAAEMLGIVLPPGGDWADFALASAWWLTKENLRVSRAAIAAAEDIGGGCLVLRPCGAENGGIAPLMLRRQPWQNYAVFHEDGKVDYYGTGDVVTQLRAVFPEGTYAGGSGLCTPTPECLAFWSEAGGSPPDSAFFGTKCPGQAQAIEKWLCRHFSRE